MERKHTDLQHIVSPPGAGETFTILGMVITVKPAGNTNQLFSLYEMQIPAYFIGVPAHVHHLTTEWFYVLRGTLAFTLDDETIMARSGSFILVVPDVIHTFWNPTGDAATLLGLRTRPDFANYLAELTDLMANSTAWPPADPAPLLALTARYDQFQAD